MSYHITQVPIETTADNLNIAVNGEIQGTNKGVYGACSDNGVHKILGAIEYEGIVYGATFVGVVPVESAYMLIRD